MSGQSRRESVHERFRAASSALFDLEVAISPDSDDDLRRRVYALRVDLGRIEDIDRKRRP